MLHFCFLVFIIDKDTNEAYIAASVTDKMHADAKLFESVKGKTI